MPAVILPMVEAAAAMGADDWAAIRDSERFVVRCDSPPLRAGARIRIAVAVVAGPSAARFALAEGVPVAAPPRAASLFPRILAVSDAAPASTPLAISVRLAEPLGMDAATPLCRATLRGANATFARESAAAPAARLADDSFVCLVPRALLNGAAGGELVIFLSADGGLRWSDSDALAVPAVALIAPAPLAAPLEPHELVLGRAALVRGTFVAPLAARVEDGWRCRVSMTGSGAAAAPSTLALVDAHLAEGGASFACRVEAPLHLAAGSALALTLEVDGEVVSAEGFLTLRAPAAPAPLGGGAAATDAEVAAAALAAALAEPLGAAAAPPFGTPAGGTVLDVVSRGLAAIVAAAQPDRHLACRFRSSGAETSVPAVLLPEDRGARCVAPPAPGGVEEGAEPPATALDLVLLSEAGAAAPREGAASAVVARVAGGYAYVAPPTLERASPASVARGRPMLLTISGEAFRADAALACRVGAGAETTLFPAAFLNASAVACLVLVPAAGEGSGAASASLPLTVALNGLDFAPVPIALRVGDASSAEVRVASVASATAARAPPTLVAVEPAAALAAGGTRV
jgi:hypothetical protein